MEDMDEDLLSTWVSQVRFPEPLAQRLKNYAQKTGASKNGIMSIAVDEYLTAHQE